MPTPRNLQQSYRTVSTEVENVDTDGNGDVEVTVGELRGIPSAAHVTASAQGGYAANVQSVDGNTVTIRLFQGGGADTELAAITGTADVTDVTVTARGR